MAHISSVFQPNADTLTERVFLQLWEDGSGEQVSGYRAGKTPPFVLDRSDMLITRWIGENRDRFPISQCRDKHIFSIGPEDLDLPKFILELKMRWCDAAD